MRHANPPRVFISHSHREPEAAGAFHALLTAAIDGLRDTDLRRTTEPQHGLPPGSYVTPHLIGDIRNCKAFVALVSPAYLESPFCLMEYAAWLGAHDQPPPMPLLFPGVAPADFLADLRDGRNRQERPATT